MIWNLPAKIARPQISSLAQKPDQIFFKNWMEIITLFGNLYITKYIERDPLPLIKIL